MKNIILVTAIILGIGATAMAQNTRYNTGPHEDVKREQQAKQDHKDHQMDRQKKKKLQRKTTEWRSQEERQ